MAKTLPVLFAALLLSACQAFNSTGATDASAETNNAPITEAQSSVSEAVPTMPNITPAVTSNTAVVNASTVDNNSLSKTLIIPQGVSLMQVFRDNNLNISDLSAMTKVDPNAALSTFQPGDKVKVILNNAHKVQTLALPNGGRFSLQPSGTYLYSAN